MNKLVAITALTTLLLTSSGCSTNKPSATPPASAPSKAVITIGTEGTYAPFTFHDKAGKLTGFDVEVAEEVSKRIGMTPRFIETKWDGMIAGLDAKRYDMVANEVAVRTDRLDKYDMSAPYIVSRAVLVVHANNTNIKTLGDLKGKKVGQSLDSNYRKIAEENGAAITAVEGFNQAVDLLTSSRIDATLNDSLSYLDLKKQRPELPIKTVYEEPSATSNAFLLRKGSTDLITKINKALSDMKSDGTLVQISQKWFNADVTK